MPLPSARGQSSRLFREPREILSTIRIHVKGIKLRITDTAGLREDSEDPIEKEGIERARKKIPEADVMLWVLDGSMPYTIEDDAVYAEIADKRVIAVINKVRSAVKIDDRS